MEWAVQRTELGKTLNSAKVISLADYRQRLQSRSETDPPRPGAAAARPVGDLIRMEAFAPMAALPVRSGRQRALAIGCGSAS
jgi:hypothetical protein